MDILKGLQHLALDDKKKSDGTPAEPTSAPAVQRHESVFDKISDALGSSHPTSTPAPAPVAQSSTSTPVSTQERLFEKLGSALGGHSSIVTPTATPPPAAAPVPERSGAEKIFSKINESINGKPTPPPPVVAAPVPEKSGTEKIFSKINETIVGKPATPVQAAKEESIFDKIGDAISGRKTPPTPAKEGNLLGKLSNAISGKKEEPARPQGLADNIADKINSALGGGAKAEAKEDKLDKAIDLFQEHVLKEGPQNNETALEQAKDKKIADAIRAAAGREKK